MSLFIASITCYILGFFMFFPFFVSSALSLDMVNRGYIKQNARRVRTMSIIEMLVWLLFFVVPFLMPIYGNASSANLTVIILIISWFLFMLVSGIQRIAAMRLFDDGIEDDFPTATTDMKSFVIESQDLKSFRQSGPSFSNL